MVYNSPKFWELTTYTDPETNTTIITGTELRQNFYYLSIYTVYSKLIIDLIAYIMIVLLNSFIITKIVHSTRFRKKITKNEGSMATPTRKTGGDRQYLTPEVAAGKQNRNGNELQIPGSNQARGSDVGNKMRRDLGM